MEEKFEGQNREVNVNFKKWLESMALMTPSTDKGGFDNNPPEEDDGGDDGDGWDWDRMELYRWHLLKWCKESDAVKKITTIVGNITSRQKPFKVEYMINRSQYPPPRYFIQIRYLFEMSAEELPDADIRRILEQSDVHRPLKIDQSQLYRLLENDEVLGYITHIILHYLANQDSSKSSPFTAAHFGWKKESILSNYFSFNVWNRLKKNWESSILPKISEIATHSRNKVERPSNWMDVGDPEVKADFSNIRIQHSGTVYGSEENSMLASVVVIVPFDWNIKS